MRARRIQRDVAMRGRDIAGVIEQYTRFVKPAFDTFVAPSRKHADIIIPWGGCGCASCLRFTCGSTPVALLAFALLIKRLHACCRAGNHMVRAAAAAG